MIERLSGPAARPVLSLLLAAWLLAGPAAAPALAAEDADLALRQAEEELAVSLRPQAGATGSVFFDANRVSLTQGGGEVVCFPDAAVPLRLLVLDGTLRQESGQGRPATEYERLAATLETPGVLVAPDLVLSGRATFENLGGEGLWGGRIGARRLFQDGSEAGVAAARESFWTDQDRRDPRGFSRVIDLSRLDRDFHLDRVSAFVDLVPRPEQRWRLESGLDGHGDGNSRQWLYSHYQFPVLNSGPGDWTVLAPNLYAETTRRDEPAYFSPDRHGHLGLLARTIQTLPDWPEATLEVEVNPQAILTDDKGAFGAHVALDLTVTLGPVTLGVGGFGYADTGEYWIWRCAAKASARL